MNGDESIVYNHIKAKNVAARRRLESRQHSKDNYYEEYQPRQKELISKTERQKLRQQLKNIQSRKDLKSE